MQNNQKLEDFKEKVRRVIISKGIDDVEIYTNEVVNFIIKNSELTGNSIEKTIENFSNHVALVERVLEPYNIEKKETRKRPIISFFSYGCLSLVIVFIIFLTIFLKSITPIYEFDETTNTVKIFGGKFSFQEGVDFKISTYNSNNFTNSNVIKINGDFTDDNEIKNIFISGTEMNFKILNSKNGFFYNCESLSMQKDYLSKNEEDIFFTFTGQVNCELGVASAYNVEFKSENANVYISKLLINTNLNITNGSIQIDSLETKINHDIKVQNGLVKGLENIKKDKNSDYKLKIKLENGVVSFL